MLRTMAYLILQRRPTLQRTTLNSVIVLNAYSRWGEVCKKHAAFRMAPVGTLSSAAAEAKNKYSLKSGIAFTDWLHKSSNDDNKKKKVVEAASARRDKTNSAK